MVKRLRLKPDPNGRDPLGPDVPGRRKGQKVGPGKRIGGRPKGGRNKLSIQAREIAQRLGDLPHEFLARVARGEKFDEWTPTPDQRIDAAKAAAPYYQPRLTATRVTGANDGPVRMVLDQSQLQQLPDELLQALQVLVSMLSQGNMEQALIEGTATDIEIDEDAYEDTLH